MSKLIFFDIDGTLINFDGSLPDSTIKALKEAQSNGHKIFLCTGRSKCQIEERLLNLGFDGIVGASGAYVEYHGKVVNAKYMDTDELQRLIDYFDDNGMVYMIQCSDKIVSTADSFVSMRKVFDDVLKDSPKNIDKIFEHQLEDDNISNHLDRYENAEKACYYLSKVPFNEVEDSLSDSFEVTEMSFKSISNDSGEISQKNITKAYGMQKLIDYLDSSVEDTVAFGDGPNDFEMLEFAKVGVAMGNASQKLKDTADMITTKITEDGIYNGMLELGLIG